MERKRRHSSLRQKETEDVNPMTAVANLFDVSIVFAVALMVALTVRFRMTEFFSQEDFTIMKNPGKENMEIITKKGNKIERYTPDPSQTDATSARGRRLGTAYELENGEIIYVED
ncbi:MAG: DUF2149 domain-containing protein [Bacteroidales bacterium]|jgi:hypothetical protein|nr:DUF2149 domain-containing protein [Bacteroidales bacterium]